MQRERNQGFAGQRVLSKHPYFTRAVHFVQNFTLCQLHCVFHQRSHRAKGQQRGYTICHIVSATASLHLRESHAFYDIF